MSEPADEPIHLVAYEADWPLRFERERALLERVLAPWIVGGIHHVGSTAVLGLAAKPVIDILVGVEDLPSTRSCIAPLAEVDYLYAPYLAEQMHWFCKPDPSRRTHHLHLVPHGSARFRDELDFRDRLRASPELARRYAELKRELAGRFEHDRDAYTDAKTEFVRDALSRVERRIP